MIKITDNFELFQQARNHTNVGSASELLLRNLICQLTKERTPATGEKPSSIGYNILIFIHICQTVCVQDLQLGISSKWNLKNSHEDSQKARARESGER